MRGRFGGCQGSDELIIVVTSAFQRHGAEVGKVGRARGPGRSLSGALQAPCRRFHAARHDVRQRKGLEPCRGSIIGARRFELTNDLQDSVWNPRTRSVRTRPRGVLEPDEPSFKQPGGSERLDQILLGHGSRCGVGTGDRVASHDSCEEQVRCAPLRPRDERSGTREPG